LSRVKVPRDHRLRGAPQCQDMMIPAEPASALSNQAGPFPDQLRLAVTAYLARFKGSSREHTESDLRCYRRHQRAAVERAARNGGFKHRTLGGRSCSASAAKPRASIAHLERTRVRAQLARVHLLYGEWLRYERLRADAWQQLPTACYTLDADGCTGVR
jgi:hypothetical protein